MGLIGAYEDGVGFGNISMRYRDNTFIITGSATGGLKKLGESHFTLVAGFSIEKNTITCQGPIIASSESLTHAAIYECSPKTQSIIHVHDMALWKKLMHRIPTTSADVTYGTPAMAEEMQELFRKTAVERKKILVMGGHEEGIISFGENLDEAGMVLMGYM